MTALVGALEVGGTHVTAAVLDLDTGDYAAGPQRLAVDSHAAAAELGLTG